MILLAAWMGCSAAPVDEAPWENGQVQIPQIEETSLICDVDRGRWELEVTADAWTGGGNSVWTVDGVYLESHLVPSFSAAEDGSQDNLLLTLTVAADWRDVKENSSTSFRCAQDPNVLFLLAAADGKVADCRIFGPNSTIWDDVSDVPPCDVIEEGR